MREPGSPLGRRKGHHHRDSSTRTGSRCEHCRYHELQTSNPCVQTRPITYQLKVCAICLGHIYGESSIEWLSFAFQNASHKVFSYSSDNQNVTRDFIQHAHGFYHPYIMKQSLLLLYYLEACGLFGSHFPNWLDLFRSVVKFRTREKMLTLKALSIS